MHTRCQVDHLQGHRIDNVARGAQLVSEFICRREQVSYLPVVNTTPEGALLHFSLCVFRTEASCLLCLDACSQNEDILVSSGQHNEFFKVKHFVPHLLRSKGVAKPDFFYQSQSC